MTAPPKEPKVWRPAPPRAAAVAELQMSDEQRAINLAGVTGLLAAVDAAAPPKRTLRVPSFRDEELFAGMHAIERVARQTELSPDEVIERLRELARAVKRPVPTLQEIARKRIRRPHPSPVAYALEEKTGDAAE